ncbi:MAG: hypothetical protein QGH85_02205 [Candidatus Pacebacteria bacterium]|jgi:intein-encoded DNA endonuclease-like protein|nr:hypothetical protein [Parcubacteria group bacterium]MDP7159422.1 hypothetical protein [Candidatus Paceibacterota bacterium]MDP7366548.1 hypothetical protein [Candidatus Paceibacterota bacterium]MDP7466410.1 hypothetical protein [Candidatus Paceibacterota bacterium]MDP7648400.1 hypothetical protein [Candidatus Paceibacterota bacterium]|tara:strand:+ start:45 stop:719 length:675 start_codon:yes stop_codon:yes gene_type:complete
MGKYITEKRMKRNKIDIKWSPNFAYAIGLMTTDGSMSSDGRHFDLTSKDRDQLINFMNCLKINVKIGHKTSGHTNKKITRIQFGSVNLYKFLLGIGMTPAKTKTIGELDIPSKYIFDFLRGHLDGDGCFYSYWDKRWKRSYMFYTVFISASKEHINWIQKELNKKIKIKGHINRSGDHSIYQLKYAKNESIKLLKKIYYNKNVTCLYRKRLKIEKALGIIDLTL